MVAFILIVPGKLSTGDVSVVDGVGVDVGVGVSLCVWVCIGLGVSVTDGAVGVGFGNGVMSTGIDAEVLPAGYEGG